jgi:hypothetical protein
VPVGYTVNKVDKHALIGGLSGELAVPSALITVKNIGLLAAVDEPLFDTSHGKTQKSVRLLVNCKGMMVAEMVLADIKHMDKNTLRAINTHLKTKGAKITLKHVEQKGHGYFRMDPQSRGVDLIPPGSRLDSNNGDDDALHPPKGSPMRRSAPHDEAEVGCNEHTRARVREHTRSARLCEIV